VAVAADRAAELILPGMNLFLQAARLTTVIVCALLALAAAARMLRIKEFDEAVSALRQAQKLL
jgi:hypothetical protein